MIKKVDIRHVWVLRIYIKRRWEIWDIYDLEAKAQRVASELDKDTSITRWPVK